MIGILICAAPPSGDSEQLQRTDVQGALRVGQHTQHIEVVRVGDGLANRHALRAPGFADRLRLADELLAFERTDGRGKRSGLRRCTEDGVSRRSSFRNGVCRSGSRSNTPETDSAPRTSWAGSLGSIARQSQLSIIVARCPPAECPATTMRRGSPPYSAALR